MAAVQPISAVGRDEQAEDQQAGLLAQPLKKQEEGAASITEMVKDAKQKADAQREKFKLAKVTPRYGDAPLEAYARLSRAKTVSQAGAAGSYARRRLVQLEAAQRSDPDHADQIKAAISQLKKAVSRANQKKQAITRDQLALARQKRAAKENRRREEQRIKQELRRAQAMRAIKESGYIQETVIANRQADALTATKMELKAQAEQLGAAVHTSVDAAMQGYFSAVQTAEAVSAPVEMPQVDVQA